MHKCDKCGNYRKLKVTWDISKGKIHLCKWCRAWRTRWQNEINKLKYGIEVKS
jgi:hypothetical protein